MILTLAVLQLQIATVQFFGSTGWEVVEVSIPLRCSWVMSVVIRRLHSLTVLAVCCGITRCMHALNPLRGGTESVNARPGSQLRVLRG